MTRRLGIFPGYSDAYRDCSRSGIPSAWSVLNRSATTDVRAALALETEATVAGMLDPATTRLMAANLLQ